MSIQLYKTIPYNCMALFNTCTIACCLDSPLPEHLVCVEKHLPCPVFILFSQSAMSLYFLVKNLFLRLLNYTKYTLIFFTQVNYINIISFQGYFSKISQNFFSHVYTPVQTIIPNVFLLSTSMFSPS